MQEKFWIVFETQNTPNPYRFYRFLDKEGAIKAAKNLANRNPDLTFGVMELVDAYMNPSAVQVQVGPIEEEPRDLCERCDDGIPF